MIMDVFMIDFKFKVTAENLRNGKKFALLKANGSVTFP